MSSKRVVTQHLRDLARLRRVRDRIDREYAQPLNVEALARTFSTRFSELVGVPPSEYRDRVGRTGGETVPSAIPQAT